MARTPNRNAKRSPKDLNRRIKKKPCQFCRDNTTYIDYKDLNTLKKFMSDRGKIRARRVTGNCEQHQHDIAEAIKTARELVLLPYTQRTVTERPQGRRGPRDDRGPREDRGERDESASSEELEGGEDVIEIDEEIVIEVEAADETPEEA
jgi:small subunit ribosomal protein S18